MICLPPVGLSTATHIFLFTYSRRRGASCGKPLFQHIYFAVALGDLSGRARDPETASSVANEVVSSQPPRASVRVSAAADA